MNVDLIIITGMSGAGKATASRVFEDMSYTVIDNLPPHLLPQLVKDFAASSTVDSPAKLAVVVDTRSGSHFSRFGDSIDEVAEFAPEPHILFLEAPDAVLVQRFKETRRAHPLFNSEGGIINAIATERALLQPIRDRAGNVIDTAGLNAQALRNTLFNFYGGAAKNHRMTVTVQSFGFKYGIPLDADLVFDVRFLRNPHYIAELRPFDGRDEVIDDYVMADSSSSPFLEKLFALIDFSLPRYQEEGKAYLTIGIGCTGGQHRSVAVAIRLAKFIKDSKYHVLIQHRDLAKP
jgi:UPF0042 nucleotide-binding protein